MNFFDNPTTLSLVLSKLPYRQCVILVRSWKATWRLARNSMHVISAIKDAFAREVLCELLLRRFEAILGIGFCEKDPMKKNVFTMRSFLISKHFFESKQNVNRLCLITSDYSDKLSIRDVFMILIQQAIDNDYYYIIDQVAVYGKIGYKIIANGKKIATGDGIHDVETYMQNVRHNIRLVSVNEWIKTYRFGDHPIQEKKYARCNFGCKRHDRFPLVRWIFRFDRQDADDSICEACYNAQLDKDLKHID